MRFISVGGDCQPAYQIRRVSGLETAFFFDWITCPIHSVMPLIRTGFADAFDEDVLSWKWLPEESAWLVTDGRYGIDSKHHFKSQEKADIARAIAFFRRSGASLLDVMNDPEPTVFVRRWNAIDGNARRDAARQNLTPLMDGGATVLFLDDYQTGEPAVDGRFIACANPYAGRWEGDDAVYDRAFALAGTIGSDI